ncbi:MAG: hypothetical protein AVO35_05585 [Candidatus Aegiribacteria sp. MLS_C]|nr:MAG: hypothetical protein AVO35_05585 [Candidatus Aegiribacteria sp. MLS_C]
MKRIQVYCLLLMASFACASEEASDADAYYTCIDVVDQLLSGSGPPLLSASGDVLVDTLLMDSLPYPDGVVRHFYYAVPEAYCPDSLNPLLVWLHGGVSTQELRTMDPEDLHEWVLVPRLVDEGYLLAFPCAQLGATWWDANGEEGVLGIVRWMKLNFSVDDSRVYVGGFSDGASGSFSLIMLHPTPFAGYLAFSGHPGVAAIDGGRATYLPSLAGRPGMVTHSDEDGLYPAGRMSPSVALAESAGADIEYHVLQGYEHDPAYLEILEDRVVIWLSEHTRERFPSRVTWEAGEPSGCDWLMVDSIVPWPLIAVDRDYNALMVSDRLQFGFYPDLEYDGAGVMVSGLAEGDLPAVRLGLMEGDVITGFQGERIADLDDIGELQSGMSPGDSFTVEIRRGSDHLDLEDRFNPPEYYWLLPRQGPSVRVEAVYDGNTFDISVNRLCRLRLLLHPEMVDFGRELRVVCNGLTVFEDTICSNYPFMLENLTRQMDPQRIYTAFLDLDLERLLPPLMYSLTAN